MHILYRVEEFDLCHIIKHYEVKAERVVTITYLYIIMLTNFMVWRDWPATKCFYIFLTCVGGNFVLQKLLNTYIKVLKLQFVLEQLQLYYLSARLHSTDDFVVGVAFLCLFCAH